MQIKTSSTPAAGAALKHWVKALRLSQWVKNILVFIPLLAAHKLGDIGLVLQALEPISKLSEQHHDARELHKAQEIRGVVLPAD